MFFTILYLFSSLINLIYCGSCGTPQIPKYMTIIPHKEIYSNGSSVYYFCRSGKVLIGKPSRTCQNGKWNFRIPLCSHSGYVDQECGHPDKPIGVNYNIREDRKISIFSCDKGLQLIGDEAYKCSHGLWSAISPDGTYGFTECHNTSLCPFSQLPYFNHNLDHNFFDPHNWIVRPGEGVKYRCADNPMNTNEDYPNLNELRKAVPIKPNWLCTQQFGWISYGAECEFGLAQD